MVIMAIILNIATNWSVLFQQDHTVLIMFFIRLALLFSDLTGSVHHKGVEQLSAVDPEGSPSVRPDYFVALRLCGGEHFLGREAGKPQGPDPLLHVDECGAPVPEIQPDPVSGERFYLSERSTHDRQPPWDNE